MEKVSLISKKLFIFLKIVNNFSSLSISFSNRQTQLRHCWNPARTQLGHYRCNASVKSIKRVIDFMVHPHPYSFHNKTQEHHHLQKETGAEDFD